MRLRAVDTGYDATLLKSVLPPGVPPRDVLKVLTYRTDMFGRPLSHALQDVMRGSSEWSVGERELFAAFVSRQNECQY
jgi:hypothetical protein